MDEVAFQDEVVAVLKKSLEGADVSAAVRSARAQGRVGSAGGSFPFPAWLWPFLRANQVTSNGTWGAVQYL